MKIGRFKGSFSVKRQLGIGIFGRIFQKNGFQQRRPQGALDAAAGDIDLSGRAADELLDLLQGVILVQCVRMKASISSLETRQSFFRKENRFFPASRRMKFS